MEYRLYEGEITAWNWNGDRQTDKLKLNFTGTDYCMLYNKIITIYENITAKCKYKHIHFMIWEEDIYELQIDDQGHCTKPEQQTKINENAPQNQF